MADLFSRVMWDWMTASHYDIEGGAEGLTGLTSTTHGDDGISFRTSSPYVSSSVRRLICYWDIAALRVSPANQVKTVTRAHASPLSNIPNAGWGAGYSRLIWAFRQEYRGNVTLELPKLHETLGPLVRIGPNELFFYSIDIYDTVHRVNSGFVKDPQNYGEFVQDEHPALFSITSVATLRRYT
ncbi:hypothetical protein BDP81DRAFT_455263 [Colletotrichum phormii]|uniref:Uncharacterized protein n=1 Tax=Colletotrichum phormii TaxID=359342 RepID=A0AAJ0EA83_9PEZI|nr:uncharacterized protein BDP81DRAFT_455263 [Colletotrichum phormii]KAK1622458.1 hypothetical protein BDP81DRAFT_455263 [Colletotrichum phormii]